MTHRIGINAKGISIFMVLLLCASDGLILPRTIAEDESPVSAPQAEEVHVPMIVPVFPRGAGAEAVMPKRADLRDSYIQLEDGSVLSVADWILGSLRKDAAGAAMSDYESRLFLGQVARAAVGMDQQLVKRSLIYTRPTIVYRQPLDTRPDAFKIGEYLLRTLILPGTPEGYNPATAGGAFSPLVVTGSTGPLLFERQFRSAMDQHVAEFQAIGQMQRMIHQQQNRMTEVGPVPESPESPE